MTVLFSNEKLTYSSNLPDDASCTVCGWATQETLHSGGTSQVLCALQNAGSGLFLGDDGTTTNLVLVQNGGATLNVGQNFAVGREFFWAFTSNGVGTGNTHVYYMQRGDNTLSATNSAGTRTAFAPSSLDIGNDGFSHPWKGRIWNVMAWNRLLTPRELLLQAFSAEPIYADATFWLPLERADMLRGYDQNRRDPTVTGTPVTSRIEHKFRLRRSLALISSDVTVGLTGSVLATAAGTLKANTTVAVSGQALISASGTLTPVNSPTLSGQILASATGTTIPNIAKALTGQATASASGTLIPALSISLSGLLITIGQGTVTAPGNVSVALTGQALSAATGTLVPASSVVLSGSQLSSARGTLTPALLISLTGQAGATAAGTLVPSMSVSLSGSLATFGQGNVSIGTGDPTPPLARTITVHFEGNVSVRAPDGVAVTAPQSVRVH